MFGVVAGVLAGAWFVAKGKPHSNVEKRAILGPRTGRTYQCDEFTDTGIIVVHDPRTGGKVAFVREPRGFRAIRCRGPKRAVDAILHDMQNPEQLP